LATGYLLPSRPARGGFGRRRIACDGGIASFIIFYILLKLSFSDSIRAFFERQRGRRGTTCGGYSETSRGTIEVKENSSTPEGSQIKDLAQLNEDEP
jgi:hypothetical protein